MGVAAVGVYDFSKRGREGGLVGLEGMKEERSEVGW